MTMKATINIYQVFTRLFRNDVSNNVKWGSIKENGVSKFNDFDDNALNAIVDLGFTHVWYTGVIRHATCTNYERNGINANTPSIVKGVAGSPYAIVDYYDVDPDLSVDVDNRMVEFEALVQRTHDKGLKFIIDFVPNHVAREYKSLQKPLNVKDLGEGDDTSHHFHPQNNFYYYPWQDLHQPDGIHFPYTFNTRTYHESPAKVTGNDAFTTKPSINDWYETVKLNYGVDYSGGRAVHFYPTPSTWIKMKDILLFWAAKGVDAFRCDMAEMVPVEFWEWAVKEVKKNYPSILFIAEVYNPCEYYNYLKKGGFDYLYDKVGLYDLLRSIIEEQASASSISNFWKSREGIHLNMLRFLENHDEQRIASLQFANDAWAGIPGMVVSATMHNCPLMVYFGQEIGEKAGDEEGFSGIDGRTTIFDYWSVLEYQKWVNKGRFDGAHLSDQQRELQSIYRKLLKARLEFEAFRDGEFYDIMYANESGLVNTDKIYAYLRYTKKQTILVVNNFDRQNGYRFKLVIPKHAVESLEISLGKKVISTDYLEGQVIINTTIERASGSGIDMEIKPKSSLIFVF